MNAFVATQNCPPATPQSTLFGGSLLLPVLVGLVLLGVGGYVLVLRPRRRRAPLLRAIPLLASDKRDTLSRAEQLLTEALSAGLRGTDLDDARFALSFVRAMLGQFEHAKYQDAVTAIAETGPRQDRSVAYLELWLRARMRDHDGVIARYERDPTSLADFSQTDRIVSISLLHRAKRRWRRREVVAAMPDFEAVWRLKVLRDELPATLIDLQVSHGVRAVLDGDLEEARRSFLEAGRRADDAGESNIGSRLGLILCAWKAGHAVVDADLGGVVDDLERALAGDPPADVDRALLGPAALLHAVLLLRDWLGRLPPRGGLPPAELDQFQSRADRAATADPDLGDALLVRGLIDYYFGHEPDQAVDTLERATRAGKGVSLPQILHLIARHQRQAAGQPPDHDPYVLLLEAFLSDGGVPIDLRRGLLNPPRHPELAPWLELRPGESAPHSIRDVVYRNDALRKLVGQLVVAPPVGDSAAVAQDRLRDLADEHAQAMKQFTASAELLMSLEQALMLRTGEARGLAEENPTDEETGHA